MTTLNTLVRRLTLSLAVLAFAAVPVASLAVLPTGPIVPPELDLFNVANWANSPLPVVTTLGTCSVTTTFTCIADSDCPVSAAGVPETCNGLVIAPGTGMRKFMDKLPGICEVSGKTAIGQCLPLAAPDTTTYPGSDYYEIGLRDFQMQFHTDLPAVDPLTGLGGTRVRGYYQKNAPAGAEAGNPHFLGPLIKATRDRPVRVLFVNELPTSAAGGNLFIPVDHGIPGAGPGPVAGFEYPENRATLHLHGGNTPWISDGTQHQWTAPANEFPGGDPLLDVYRKGLATNYVPDMWFDATTGAPITSCLGLTICTAANATNNPGEGKMTFYWPNQQSGRFLFYHDHAYAITRLNVYAGEAAGYLLVDPADEDVLATAGVPGTLGTTADLTHVLPLVIQDKTFVPPPAQLAATDPTWDTAKYGGFGSMWFPHVYTPNQWPGDPGLTGANPMGRWDYGPWFWPVQTQLTAGSPTVFDVTVPCRTMASVAPGGTPITTACPITPNPTLVPESFLDTLVVNGTPYPTVTVDPVAYRFQILNASQERHVNLSFFVADATGKDVRMVDAVPHQGGYNAVGARGTALPAVCSATAPLSQVTGLPFGPDMPGVPYCWPKLWPSDARAGGVPNPADAGPAIVQIGSEGGILPSPVVIPAQPVDYEANKRNIVVLNVTSKGLFMGSAERADVVVDFSQYAGKTLILYNDAPAPVPAGDPRNDYYTGNQDTTTTGGAPEIVPGYGPNTRTIMQVVVNAAPAGAAWNQANLANVQTAMTQVFKAKQPTPIVPEAAYSAVAGTTLSNTYLPIQALNLNFTPVGGTNAINVVFANKAIHELFDVDYGRMDSVLGVEIPNTNWVNQTTIPFTNGDPTTEWIADSTPQIWKITHNGVDTHAIHFHLLNAQVINRVGWDGAIRAPDANELGWKETIRMNPLEDIIVALQPVHQNLPWPLPDSRRPIDVTTPVGSPSPLFSGVNTANVPYVPALLNSVQNFGQEYVWHCHLLGHEENDMLRAEVFVVPPEVPTLATATVSLDGKSVLLSWMDNSASELGFTIQRSLDALFTTVDSYNVPRFAPDIVNYGNLASYTDATVALGTTYFYRVLAYKTFVDLAAPGGSTSFSSSSAWSNTAVATTLTPPAASIAPNPLAFGNQAVKTSATQTVTLTNTGGSVLTISSVVLTAPAPAQYTMVNGCTAPLAALGTCTVSVTFAPTVLGAATASLAFTTGDPVNPLQTVAITGFGTGAVVSVSPLSLAFGTRQVGVTTAAQTVTLSNTGNDVLLINSNSVTGVDAAMFPMSTTCGPTLAALASCSITVSFTAASVGAKTAAVTLSTNAFAGPTTTVPLSGTGAASAAVVSPTSLAFPVTLVQNRAAAKTVTLSNPGTWPLAISGITVTGANVALFPMTTTCGVTLAAGSSCTMSVVFAPTSAGNFSAAISIASDALGTPVVTVPMTGTGTAIAVSTTSLNFGNVVLTRTSTGLNVTVLNNGLTTLTGLTIASSSPQFIFTNNCGTTLNAGRNCTVTVRFRPTATGPQTGTLSIGSSDPVNPVVISLSGTGVTPVATLVSPASGTLSFTARQNTGYTATQNVVVKNTGTATLTINNVAINSPNARNWTIASNTCNGNIAVGASCTVGVRFRAFAVGTVAGTLGISVQAPASNVTVTLSGTGTP